MSAHVVSDSGNAGTRGADRDERGGVRSRVERGDAVVVAGMKVNDPSAGGDGVASCGSEVGGSAWNVRLVALAVERDLQERGARVTRRCRTREAL